MKNLLLILLLLSPFLIYAQFGEQQIIYLEASGPWSIYVTDVNGDGNLDVLSASTGDDNLSWFENEDGLGSFGEKNIITGNLDQTRYITAADIDGDLDMDVLATSFSDDLLVWFENTDGLGNFGSQQIISSTIINPYKTIAVDVDTDGDLDIIGAFPQSNRIAWFENTDGLGSFGAQQLIGNNTINVFSIDFADINGDEIKDVICDSSNNGIGHPSWFENDGNGNFGPQQEITNDTLGSIYVLAEDIDNDGDMDVLNIEFGGETIAWYENIDGLGTFGPKQIITNEVNAPFNIFMADLDNDGDKDIIYNTQEVIDADYVAWRANDGDGNFGEEQVISTNVIAPRGLFAADIDNDGYLDVLSSSIADNKIAWYKNLTYLGVNDYLLQEVVLLPNPVNDILNISAKETINSVSISNVLGQVIYDSNIDAIEATIDMFSYTKGTYFVRITVGNNVTTKKIIKE